MALRDFHLERLYAYKTRDLNSLKTTDIDGKLKRRDFKGPSALQKIGLQDRGPKIPDPAFNRIPEVQGAEQPGLLQPDQEAR